MERNKKKIVPLVIFSLFVTSTFLLPLASTRIIETRDSTHNPEVIPNPFNTRDNAIVYLEKYNQETHRIIKEPLKELTRIEAEQLKEELKRLENSNYGTEEIITEQLNILHRWDILPQEIKFETFENILDNIKENLNTNPIPSDSLPIVPRTMILGPSITTFLSIGGFIYPMHLFLPGLLQPILMEKWLSIPMDEILNGTILEGWLNILPVYVPFSSTYTLVAPLGLVYDSKLLLSSSPFVAIMVPSIGISIAVSIYENIRPVSVFDLGIYACALGVIIYFEGTTPEN